MKPKPRIVIVDDHVSIMRCVGAYLSETGGMEVVGYASHAQGGVALATEAQPDLVLSDIRMHGADPFDACQELTAAANGATKVLFYTGYPRDQFVDRCMDVGGFGIVTKHAEPLESVALAIRHVLRGRTYFSPDLAKRIVDLNAGKPRSLGSMLSERERSVLKGLSLGKTNHDIAKELNLSLRSVEKEVSQLKRKLNQSSTAGLIMYAANEGIAFPELQSI